MSKLNSRKAILERTNPKIRHGRHCVFLIHVHLVFVTKYRKTCFTPRILEHLKEIFANICVDFGARLKEFNGEGDHVHLLVDYPPQVSISKMVNSLKGVSSRFVRAKKYPEISKKLWGDSLWSPPYFAGSCGGASLDVLTEYIQNQESPSGERSASPA